MAAPRLRNLDRASLAKVRDLCRKLGMSEHAFYRWAEQVRWDAGERNALSQVFDGTLTWSGAWSRFNFDQILSKQEGTCGSSRGLRWTLRLSQLLGTTENMRNDTRLPVGQSRPHNPKVAGSNPAPATN